MLKTFNEPPRPNLPGTGLPLLALGFRPFFILAGLAAVLGMGVWLGLWSRGATLGNGYGLIPWHGHEMLFGYGVAVVAGFLLTAVRNWTGINTPNGIPLALLALLWLAGRLLPWLAPWLPAALVAAVDLAFLPLLALALQGPLWQGKQRSNRIFVPILLVMALANLLFHLQPLGLAPTAQRGNDAMLLLLVLLVAIIGGRVMPFFAQSVLPGFQPRRFEWAEQATLWVLAALALAVAAWPNPWLVAPLGVAAAFTQAVRFYGWHSGRVWARPILWVLYAGFGWLIFGLFLWSLATAGLAPMSAARHALTVGGIGVVTLGMMARVSLGHTGRPIQPPGYIGWSFIALNLAAALRVFGPWVMPEKYNLWLHLSGGLWVLCFLAFLIHYVPILLKPRPDGQAG
jgi:uncharacterized protein involved in response to NO